MKDSNNQHKIYVVGDYKTKSIEMAIKKVNDLLIEGQSAYIGVAVDSDYIKEYAYKILENQDNSQYGSITYYIRCSYSDPCAVHQNEIPRNNTNSVWDQNYYRICETTAEIPKDANILNI